MKKNILLAVCFLMPLATMAQNDTLGHERNITLSEAIVLARTQSVDAAVALNELKTAYWEYRTCGLVAGSEFHRYTTQL